MPNDARSFAPRGWRRVAALAQLAAALACSSGDSAEAPHPGRGVYVPASWQAARGVTGHDVHVVQHQVACASCHAIGQSELGSVSPARCAACHEKEASISHAANEVSARLKAELKSDCTLCHRFSDNALVRSFESLPDGAAHVHQAGDCAHCHGKRQALTPAVQIHDTGKCLDCHKPHDSATPQSGPCADCHRDVTPTHALAGKTPNQVCTTCHEKQHAPASEALTTCVPCHEKTQPTVPASALFADGHVACVGCHQPHQFGKDKAVACRTCHEDVAVLGAGHGSGHQQCTNCHSAHDVMASPDQACARCHTDKHPDHPKKGKVGACVGCHDPHPAGAQLRTRVRDCSTCHQNAGGEKAFHAGVDCKRCHAPHDFVRDLSDQRACEACHAPQLASVRAEPGHQACQGCHTGLPHRPQQGMAGCSSCHGQQSAQVAAGHRECTQCHEPHGAGPSAGCDSCHRPQLVSAAPGHRDCRRCHEPHSGAAAAACGSCHASQAQSPHGRISAACADCHRPHGPGRVDSPPACQSCHQPARLPGLHRRKEHATCNRCHSGHGEPAGARREGCLSCHQDRKQHFADAPSCASCHLFGPTR